MMITNDNLVEGSEEFSLLLLEDPFAPSSIQTIFNASLATVTILDDDGKSVSYLFVRGLCMNIMY